MNNIQHTDEPVTSIKMAATMSKPFVKTAHEVRCNNVKRESKAFTSHEKKKLKEKLHFFAILYIDLCFI